MSIDSVPEGKPPPHPTPKGTPPPKHAKDTQMGVESEQLPKKLGRSQPLQASVRHAGLIRALSDELLEPTKGKSGR